MRVLMTTAEATPFAQTGGLGEVLSALPAELVDLGVEVDVIMPGYSGIDAAKHNLETTDINIEIDLNAVNVAAGLRQLTDGRGVRYLFVDNSHYYDRDGLYGPVDGDDYEDNSERFVFLCRAAIEMALNMGKPYDVFHSHDWQAALVPVYLRTLFAGEGLLRKSASVLTIHNLGYQGIFGSRDMRVVGLDWQFFNPDQMEFYGKLNFLKSGIVFSDEVTTVSPGYREEILTPEFGFGLEGVLQEKGPHLTGILNGVDYSIWNPATDSMIAAKFSPEDLSGKAECKAAMQRLAGLAVRPEAPMIAMVSRLSSQKGIDLVDDLAHMIKDQDVQFVLLGTGEPRYQESFESLAREMPEKVIAYLTYDLELAHKIFAASDILLVPSRYEPCGLSQLYGLKYGAIPVVRATGGLNDTVEEFSQQRDEGTGFKFFLPEPTALEQSLRRALKLYWENPDGWKRLMVRAMTRDFSWTRSANEYKRLYERAMANRLEMVGEI